MVGHEIGAEPRISETVVGQHRADRFAPMRHRWETAGVFDVGAHANAQVIAP